MSADPLLWSGVVLGLLVCLLVGRSFRRRRPTVLESPPSEEGPSGEAVPSPEEELPVTPTAALLRDALASTRSLLRRRLDDALGREGDLEETFDALEEALIGADVGAQATTAVLARVRERCGAGARDALEIRAHLTAVIAETLAGESTPSGGRQPWVVLVCGVNGVGKTTTIAKLAARYRNEGKRVLLVAADTFRAAAADQLAVWADRVGADIVRHQPGGDPAAVAFDGVRAGLARDVDVVIVDTAGRLHTRQNLMEEITKIPRVMSRELPEAPHEVLLVLDGTTGQNAVRQARAFCEALPVTGIIVTKLDGTAKGGAVLAVRHELGVPIRYVGIGEGLQDLKEFSAAEFARDLLGDENRAGTSGGS